MPLHKLEVVQMCLSYWFKDRDLLIEALTHPSFFDGIKNPLYSSYNRLEFLGDKCLNFIATENLYAMYPEATSSWLHYYVLYCTSNKLYANRAYELGIGSYVYLNPKYKPRGGLTKTNKILANVLEALHGAIYLDDPIQGFRFAREVFERTVWNHINFVKMETFAASHIARKK